MARPKIGQRQIFRNGHAGSRAPQRVLEQPANALAALVVRHIGDVLAVQHHGAGIRPEGACNGPEQRGFSRAVGAQHCDKISGLQMQIDAAQGLFLIDRAWGKGFLNIRKGQHLIPLLSFPPAGQAGRWPGLR